MKLFVKARINSENTYDTNISFALFKTPANIRYLPMNCTEIKIRKKERAKHNGYKTMKVLEV